MNNLAKQMQVGSAKLIELVGLWLDGKTGDVSHLENEIIEIERKADEIKEELVEGVFAKGGYLPYSAEERFRLVTGIDKITARAEIAARFLASKKVGSHKPPKLKKMSQKIHSATDELQDALKLLWKDFKGSRNACERVEKVREEARDLYFEILREIFQTKGIDPIELMFLKEAISLVLDVVVEAEKVSDHIQALVVKHL